VNVIYEGDDVANALVINSHWIMWGAKYRQPIPISSLS
jgi:hypothetical protein